GKSPVQGEASGDSGDRAGAEPSHISAVYLAVEGVDVVKEVIPRAVDNVKQRHAYHGGKRQTDGETILFPQIRNASCHTAPVMHAAPQLNADVARHDDRTAERRNKRRQKRNVDRKSDR